MKLKLYIGLSVIVHLVLFFSVFDIYFTSPIIHGVQEFKQDVQPLASRLVLFVADGLRADKFFELNEYNQSRAPFLRKIIENNGRWGVSHTRVPTESRPGHVALIAGFYEDVSAVMKGWKENPVEFDSVFNRSRNTWAFGSPDILPMFAKGASSNVHIDCYHGDIESFAGSDSSLLDDWVFDKFTAFLNNASKNKTSFQMLNENQVVFFLHLLGIDTNGHSHKPWSKEYLANIEKVDRGIQNVVNQINDFYKDNKTAYVFTSDHGMTDWGSHGAGLPSETLTPLVVWGSGAINNGLSTNSLVYDKFDSRSWGLDSSTRHDVNQADIAPLMSSLVGIPIPVNSVGVLPLSYLSSDLQTKAKLMYTNARQISEQYRVKFNMIKNNSLYFKSFEKLPLSKLIDMERQIKHQIHSNSPAEAIELSLQLIDLSLEGVQYYHTYHRTPLYSMVVIGFLGWIILTLILTLKKISFINAQSKKSNMSVLMKNSFCTYFFLFLALLILLFLYYLCVPITYYLYFILPLPVWHYIIMHRNVLQSSLSALLANAALLKKCVLFLTIGLIGVWALIFSFFNRFILSLELIVFGFLVLPTTVSSQIKLRWVLICSASAVFPFLPVVGRDSNAALVILGGAFASLSAYMINRSLKCAIIFLPLFCGCLAVSTSFISSNSGEVPLLIHVLSWSILCSSWVFPLCVSTRLFPRMLCVFVCHSAVYILMSLSYDALFCVVFCLLLSTWIILEIELCGSKYVELRQLDFSSNLISLETAHDLSFHTLRQSYALLFFLVFAFFGVGNIASINSFDIHVVLPFITVFQPFIMGFLLAYKVLLPYLLVVCAFCCVALATKTSLDQLFLVGLIMCDVMGIHFFFMVKDHGSWLDIGTSISHYVIGMSMIASLLVFLEAAKFLTAKKIVFKKFKSKF